MSEFKPFNPNDRRTFPTKYGRYQVILRGKVETVIWNGTGWATNHKEITAWK